MRHLSQSVDYSRDDDFRQKIETFSLEEAKKSLLEIHEEYRSLHKIAYRASVSIDQYKNFMKIIEDFLILDKENQSNNGNCLQESFILICSAFGQVCHYLMVLTDYLSELDFNKNDKDVVLMAQKFFKGIYDLSKFSKLAEYIPQGEDGLNVKNLERSKAQSHEKKKEKQIYRNRNLSKSTEKKHVLPNHKAKFHDKPSSSTKLLSNVAEFAKIARRSLDDSERLSESESTEGGDDKRAQSQEKSEGSSKNKKEHRKHFSVKYHNADNLFTKEDFQRRKIKKSSIVKNSGKRRSSSLDHAANSISISNRGYVSSSTYENNFNYNRNSFSNADDMSKKRRKYKRKHSLNVLENNINDSNYNVSQNSIPISKKSCRFSKSVSSSTLQNDTNSLVESKTSELKRIVGSSKRHQRSSRYHSSNEYESGLSESGSKKSYKKFKRANSPVTSDAETEDAISREKPKRRRRGRRRKTHRIEEQESQRSSDDENELYYSSNYKGSIKNACVHLSDVLEDPEVQHYIDVIKYRGEKSNENIKSMKLREKKDNVYSKVRRNKGKNEKDETTITKEKNENETLQEWNVVDAASDEEDKDQGSNDDGGELSDNSNDGRQESHSNADQEQNVDCADGGQIENNDSDRENDYCSSGDLFDDNCNNNEQLTNENTQAERDSSDSETKEHKRGPSTPDEPHPESDLDANSEDDGDANSVTSFEDGSRSQRDVASDPHLDGKTGPRTPPSPPPSPNVFFRRGPQTPPGIGPDSEVSGRPFESFLQE